MSEKIRSGIGSQESGSDVVTLATPDGLYKLRLNAKKFEEMFYGGQIERTVDPMMLCHWDTNITAKDIENG